MSRDDASGDWICQECGFATKIKQRMSQHIESKHISAESICEVCLKRCPTRNALRVHKFRYHKNLF